MQENSEDSISVMVVEDHRTVLWGLERLIDSRRPRMKVVATACDCEEAIAKVNAAAPDVMVLDINPGQRNALDILTHLTRDAGTQVLILTDLWDRPTLDLGMIMGARGVVGKDESPEVLLNAIEKVHSGELWLDRESTARVFNALREKEQKVDHEMRKLELLTPREHKVVDAVMRDFGTPHKLIAKELFMSESTLRNHLTSIYRKLDVDNRINLYLYISKHGSKGAA